MILVQAGKTKRKVQSAALEQDTCVHNLGCYAVVILSQSFHSPLPDSRDEAQVADFDIDVPEATHRPQLPGLHAQAAFPRLIGVSNGCCFRSRFRSLSLRDRKCPKYGVVAEYGVPSELARPRILDWIEERLLALQIREFDWRN